MSERDSGNSVTMKRLPFHPLIASAAIGILGLFAISIVAVVDLPPTWGVLLLIGAVSLAFLVWTGDPRNTLLTLFVITVPIEVSKALTSEASAYSPTLSLFLSDLSLIPLLAFWFYDRFISGSKGPITSIHVAAILLFVWVTISAAISISSTSWSILLNIAKYTVSFFVIADYTRDPNRLRIVLYALAAGLALQLFMVALQLITGSDLQIRGSKNTDLGRLLMFEQGGGEHFRRPSGFLSHPNVFADYVTFLLPPLASLALMGEMFRKRIRFWIAVLASAACGGLVLSLSRGGWIAFGAAFLFVFVSAWFRGFVRPRQVAVVIVVAIVGLAAITVVFPAAIYRVTLSDQRSSESRWAMMDQALLIIKRNPVVGVGLAGYNKAAQTNIPTSFAGLLPAFRETLLKGVVHNKYLLTFAETGIVGVLLLCYFLLTLILAPFKCDPRRGPEQWLLLLGLSGSIVAQAVFFGFDHFSYDTRLALLYLTAGIIVGVRAQFGVPGHYQLRLTRDVRAGDSLRAYSAS
jgi:putative inorganic carbon (HCO3(-)) transporter